MDFNKIIARDDEYSIYNYEHGFDFVMTTETFVIQNYSALAGKARETFEERILFYLFIFHFSCTNV